MYEAMCWLNILLTCFQWPRLSMPGLYYMFTSRGRSRPEELIACRPLYACINACMHACMYVGPMYVPMYVCMMYACMYACINVCVCMHVCMYICMYPHYRPWRPTEDLDATVHIYTAMARGRDRVASLTLGRLYPLKSIRYLLYRRLSGPQN